MESVRNLLEQQPLVALFFTIAVGYLVGQINVKGLSLGVGAVLFVALAVGWFAPKSAPAPMVGMIGLALFLYTVGIQYGKQFFVGLTSAAGLKANLMALAGVLCSGLVAALFGKTVLPTPGHALGLFAGSGTSTPTLQAAIATLGTDDPAIGYSVAYPFGVAGPILLLYLTFIVVKPKITAATGAGLELLEIALKRAEHFGKRLSEVTAALPKDVQVLALRRGDRNQPAPADAILGEGDVLLLAATSRALLEQARDQLGHATQGLVTQDRRDLDYLRVFASRPSVVGRTLADLDLPGGKGTVVVHVRRGDAELQARQDVVLELGDRVGVLAHRNDFPALRKFFGDSIKGTAEFSYVSIGLGMAVGMLVGAIAIPVPGIGAVSLGLCGVLIIALMLGKLRRTRSLTWTMPLSANLVLRNLGLTLFLAQVGMASGPKFAAGVAETGLLMLGLGAIVLLALILPILVLGLLLRMPYDELAGVVAGGCGNPAILAYASKLAPTDKPDLGYAMIFPGMTIAKILFVSIAPAFL